MNMKITSVSDNLSQIIKTRLGNPVNKSLNTGSAQQASRDISERHGVKPQYTFDKGMSLYQRADRRQKLLLLRKQQNIETIMALALEYCPAVTTDQQPDPDWIERFIELAEDSSNKKMQQLWAKIMMGEMVHPGSFSYKSLLSLKQMTQKEASALQLCGSLSARNTTDNASLMLSGYYKKPSFFDLFRKQTRIQLNLAKTGLSYPDILTLIDIDILYAQEIESAALSIGDEFQLNFNNASLTLTAKTSDLVLTYYKMTYTGNELIRLANAAINTQFKSQLEEMFCRDFTLYWK